MSAPIKVVVVSDFLCVFSYIADTILRRAAAKVQAAHADTDLTFDIEYRPFRLAVEASYGMSRQEYFRARIGKEKWAAGQEMIPKMANEYGLDIGSNFGEGTIKDTKPAHMICRLAYVKGGSEAQAKVMQEIFHDLFSDADKLSIQSVAAAAQRAGLMTEQNALTFLDDAEGKRTACHEQYSRAVEQSTALAIKAGIQGCPFIVIDNKWTLSGVQTEDALVQIFEKLADSPRHCSGSALTTPALRTADLKESPFGLAAS